MIVFLKKNHKQTGIHRFLESFKLYDKCKFVLVDTIEETNEYEDKIGIFGGFLPRDLLNNYTIKEKYYTFCSPFGQADLSSSDFYSVEISILGELLRYIKAKRIKNAITQSKSLRFRFGFIWIPPVKLDIIQQYHEERRGYGFLGNNLRKHKNVANQLSAISLLQPKEPIIVSQENYYAGFGEIFDCEFKSKDLKTDKDYYREISTHRLCFQCSWSEAFDYQAFEYMFMGVPVIFSPCLDWIPVEPIFYNGIVYNPDSSENINRIAQGILDKPSLYKLISESLYEWAPKFNKGNMEKLNKIIKMDFE
jgi:glycosyltransferase involved in cell wall biosynthesis